MALKQGQFNDIVMADPAVKGVTCNVGGGQMNTGSMIIHLKPLSERKIGVVDVLNRLRRKLAVVPGATLFMQPQQDIQIGGRLGNSQYQFTLQSEDLSELNRWAPIMLEKLKTLPGCATSPRTSKLRVYRPAWLLIVTQHPGSAFPPR